MNLGILAKGRETQKLTMPYNKIQKTLPINNPNKFNIAFCSCSNYPAGYFNAYKEMANDEEVDLVLHLGDYLYEYSREGAPPKV